MPISVNSVTKVIDVPQSYLTVVTPGVLFELDTDLLRRDLRAWEATEAGRTEDRTHDHNPQYTVAGVTYARKVELINGYSWQLEDTGSHYTCRLAGSNNNLFDVANGIFIPHGNVTLIPGNSAGLQTVNTGGTTPALEPLESAALLQIGTVLKMMRNKMITDPVSGLVTIYDDDGTTVLYQGNIYENVAGTIPYAGNGINRRDRLE